MYKYFLSLLRLCLGLALLTPQLRAEVTPIELQEESITALMAQKPYAQSKDGSHGIAGFRNAKNYLWGKALADQNAKVQWQVIAPKAQEYIMVAILSAMPEATVKVTSTQGSISAQGLGAEVVGDKGGWQRLTIGSLAIPAGQSELELEIVDSASSQLKSIELLPTVQWEKHLQQVAEFRAQGAKSNFTDKIYGVMFHWGNWSVDPEGNRKEWPKMFDEFDWEAWADMIAEMGAGYVVFTTSWGEFFFAAPIESIESINPGRSTIQYGGEDYFMKMADVLNERGIELILYFHHGQGDAKRLGKEKGTWWTNLNNKLAEGAQSVPDYEGRDIFNGNYRAIISEIGERYGDKLYGWWFDDGCLLYPQDFHALASVVRAGNPQRLVTYNNSKLAPFTEYQDYAAGEWTTGYKKDGLDAQTGLISRGRNVGFIPFGLVRAENHWAAFDKAKRILVKEDKGTGAFAKAVLQAAEVGYNMTFNVMMYTDGSVHPTTLEKLKNAKKALEEAGYERSFEPIER